MSRSAAATLAFAADVLARDGQLWSVIRTASMTPFLRPGDRVLTVPLGAEPPRTGDVLAVADGDRVLVHRLLRVTPLGLVLKGDALVDPDPPVDPVAIVGRVVAVARDGRVHALRRRRARMLGRLVAWYSTAVASRRFARGPRAARIFRLPLYAAAALVPGWRW